MLYLAVGRETSTGGIAWGFAWYFFRLWHLNLLRSTATIEK